MGGQLRRALVAFDPEVRAAHDDRASALLRSRSFDPIGARATRTWSGDVPAVRCEVVTSVARALPPLELAPEPPFAGLRRLFRGRRDIVVGDDAFDGLFEIEGTEEAARLLLPPIVRLELVRLSRSAVPTVSVSKGVVSVVWSDALSREPFEQAIRVCAALRRIAVP
jgi:hypothetical protein